MFVFYPIIPVPVQSMVPWMCMEPFNLLLNKDFSLQASRCQLKSSEKKENLLLVAKEETNKVSKCLPKSYDGKETQIGQLQLAPIKITYKPSADSNKVFFEIEKQKIKQSFSPDFKLTNLTEKVQLFEKNQQIVGLTIFDSLDLFTIPVIELEQRLRKFVDYYSFRVNSLDEIVFLLVDSLLDFETRDHKQDERLYSILFNIQSIMGIIHLQLLKQSPTLLDYTGYLLTLYNTYITYLQQMSQFKQYVD